jgi:hypothetical protein
MYAEPAKSPLLMGCAHSDRLIRRPGMHCNGAFQAIQAVKNEIIERNG